MVELAQAQTESPNMTSSAPTRSTSSAPTRSGSSSSWSTAACPSCSSSRCCGTAGPPRCSTTSPACPSRPGAAPMGSATATPRSSRSNEHTGASEQHHIALCRREAGPARRCPCKPPVRARKCASDRARPSSGTVMVFDLVRQVDVVSLPVRSTARGPAPHSDNNSDNPIPGQRGTARRHQRGCHRCERRRSFDDARDTACTAQQQRVCACDDINSERH